MAQSDAMVVDTPLDVGGPSMRTSTVGSSTVGPGTMGDIDMVPDKLLIGFGGKCDLKRSAQPVLDGKAEISDFIAQFKAKHSINAERVQPILALLKMGGMSRERISREILVILIDHFKRKIIDLSQPQLTKLLDKSYSYLTVPELRPIATLVLERLDYVDTQTWSEIVDNGLTESPYTDLPFSIKRKIWRAIPSSFDFELEQLIKVIPDYQEPASFDEILRPEDRANVRKENKLLQQFLKVLGNDDGLIVPLIDKMVEVAALEKSTARRRAYANMFHDILSLVTPRRMPNVEKLRQMARYLDRGGENMEMELAQVRDIREGLSESASCGPVALLVSSTYTRDLVTDQLVHNLIMQRKLLPKHPSPADFSKRAAELQRDPFLKDLTYICLSNMRSQRVLMENVPLHDGDGDSYYVHFYPRVCNEIAIDDQQMQDSFYRGNARLPHPDLVEAVQKDSFERRILISYALMLFARENMVAVSKLRLVLDYALQRCDSSDEGKEIAVAHGLIMQVMDA